MSQKKRTLIGGVAVLSIAGMLSKVIGMFFRIPLANMIESSGMGIYQAVYPTYTMLLTISTAGIPVAISRLVSESVTLSRDRQARAILRTAVILLAAIGAFLTVLLIAFARPLAARTGDPAAAIGFVAIAPSILVVSLISALRGYMQGRGRMTPTAISQLIEQIAKVIISFPLAAYLMRTQGVIMAATGALLGITIGECCALLYMFIVYKLRRREFAAAEALDHGTPPSGRTLAGQMLRIAVPITIGSMIVPLAGFIDSAMIRVRLIEAGFLPEMARSLYGLLSGFVLPLVNVPTMLATAICIGLVPAISAARIRRDAAEMQETSRLGLRLSSLIGMPCAVGMSMLAAPIIQLIYPSLPPDELAIAGRILSLSAWTIVLFTHVQGSTGILQGAGMHKIPVYSLVIGVVLKVTLNYLLIGIPRVNIIGAPIASITCYAVSMLINILWIVRKTGMRFDWGSIVIRPGLATGGMALAVLLITQVMDMSRKRGTLLAIAVGVAVYVLLIFVLGALRQEDMAQIPGGSKLERLMIRLRIWRA